jgi:hypothetical protein
MTAQLEKSLAGALLAYTPRPGFSNELLAALRQAAAVSLFAEPSLGRARERWLWAGSIAGVATAASAAFYGVVRLNRRGTAA